MNVVVFGASGMVGKGVLLECLEDGAVASVLVVGRSPCGLTHPKLVERMHPDFFDYAALAPDLAGRDACFFCLGVSAAGMSEPPYHRLTYELTVAAAEGLVRASPGLVFCYVSGAGTDSSERGRFMWARVKGKTENQLLRMPMEAVMFRPGYIQPLKGVRSKTTLYRVVHRLIAPLFPVLRRIVPGHVTTTQDVGRAMLRVAREGQPKRVLETRDINELAQAA